MQPAIELLQSLRDFNFKLPNLFLNFPAPDELRRTWLCQSA